MLKASSNASYLLPPPEAYVDYDKLKEIIHVLAKKKLVGWVFFSDANGGVMNVVLLLLLLWAARCRNCCQYFGFIRWRKIFHPLFFLQCFVWSELNKPQSFAQFL